MANVQMLRAVLAAATAAWGPLPWIAKDKHGCPCECCAADRVRRELFTALVNAAPELIEAAAEREKLRTQLADEHGVTKDALAHLRFQRDALAAESARLRRRVEQLEAALQELHAWADGYANKRTGMGAGLHVEMWPMLGPAAAKELLRRAREALDARKDG